MPVVGYLTASTFQPWHAGIKQGLSETGYVEGRNIAIVTETILQPLARDEAGREVTLQHVNNNYFGQESSNS
jgi:hypothetical protein